jgi:pSer/pThr/pTyr-binding forkhead associated (FHA) protein
MKQPPLIVVQLVHLLGPFKGEIQDFTQSPITIGRHPTCSLKFPADLAIVSRKHAEIVRDGNRFKIVDLSVNGTFLNGKRVTEAFLKSGDVLTFAEGGPKVSFLAEMKEGQPEIEVPNPSPATAPPQEPTPPVTPSMESGRAAGPRPAESPPLAPKPSPPPAVDRPPVYSPEVVADEPANMPLVFQYGPTVRSFKQLPITVGRHMSCQIRIDHPAILDIHVQIFFAHNQYWIKDLTGRDLVRINGRQVGMQAPLSANDMVAFSPQGPVFRFLAGGRLAEAQEEVGSEASGDLLGGKGQRPGETAPEGKSDRERPSILKRFLR